ncbi:restriction endonuclease [Proteus mirabilis]|uniref:restriction endonuclease n=1 Tax=Proteus mirabilis TaxID=584 RepID=UPI0018C4D5ED|nr:restriction endonuclease [Proteus mirabilis]EKW1742719.1 restriction endonuclease [Proteus mirabilis]EMA4723253.1 restriction endonuclease [Proteus mirabilis]MBG3126173.1 restriction endonuclease [Proteus mirabilis]MDF7378595.1 restriction endonuclease [Proteus mirabilis]
MGTILFKKHTFANHLHEIIGYKSGVATSIEQMCDLLSGSGFEDNIISSETYGIRIRSEDYDRLYYTLLHKIGVTDKPFWGIFEIFDFNKKIENKYGFDFGKSITDIYYRNIKIETENAIKEGRNLLNPEKMMKEAFITHGKIGLNVIIQLIEINDNVMKHSPHTMMKFHQYSNIVNLSDLFDQYNPIAEEGTFLDQRFIDYLSNNTEKLGDIHWRKFEELTAECFKRFGYKVSLGPGSNDDGVDLRVWHETKEGAPNYIIQCKRVKSKIDKVVIKGLYTDIIHEGCELGFLVTSSELSLGARSTIDARSYPIEEVNKSKIIQWLKELRTPGTGIIRL